MDQSHLDVAMTSKRARIIFGIGFVATIIAMGIYRYAQWERTETIVLPNGRAVADVPRSETGPFGAPDRIHLRRQYLANLEAYRVLPMADVRLDGSALAGSEHFIPAIRERLSGDPASVAALAALPDGAAKDLEQALVLVFSRMAGLSLEAYRERLRTERKWEGPSLLPEYWDETPGRKSSDDPESALAAKYENLDLREGRLIGVASSVPGWRIVVRSVSSARGGNQFILSESCSPDDVKLFWGGMGMKAQNFHHWPSDWRSFSKTNPTMHLAEASAVIQTANGYRYPLDAVFVFDSRVNRWRLSKAFRQVTVRVARIGGLTF